MLTWWQGDISVHGFGKGEDVIADRKPTRTSPTCGPATACEADLHEFELTPQGTALITAYDPIRCNLTEAGGPSNGAVTDSLLPGDRHRTGLVHVPVDEPRPRRARRILRTRGQLKRTASPFDYFHLNSISVDRDGSLLDLLAQHLGGVRPEPEHRADQLAAGRTGTRASARRRTPRPPGSTTRVNSKTAPSASSTTALRRPIHPSRGRSS